MAIGLDFAGHCRMSVKQYWNYFLLASAVESGAEHIIDLFSGTEQQAVDYLYNKYPYLHPDVDDSPAESSMGGVTAYTYIFLDNPQTIPNTREKYDRATLIRFGANVNYPTRVIEDTVEDAVTPEAEAPINYGSNSDVEQYGGSRKHKNRRTRKRRSTSGRKTNSYTRSRSR